MGNQAGGQLVAQALDCTGLSNTSHQHEQALRQNQQVPRNVPQEWHSEIVVSVVVTNLQSRRVTFTIVPE